MKRPAILVLLLVVALVSACGGSVTDSKDSEDVQAGSDVSGDATELQSALDDWILGTDLGIQQGSIDLSAKTVTLVFPSDRYAQLTDVDRTDIETAMADLLSGGSGVSLDSLGYRLVYDVDGTKISTTGSDDESVPEESDGASDGEAKVNLVFIHHSVGENWLNDGLCRALNDRGYHVADIYYGWREYGDRTDTVDWPMWFTDEVMSLVYEELDSMTAPNALRAAPGQNTIVMFKSCFPNSDVGSDISDEKAIYNGLVSYFEQNPDKMFVLVTPPPMQEIPDPGKTRELCDWLVDRQSGWLAGLGTGNVFVFDLYNVLTDPDAHHRLVGSDEVHESVAGRDTLYYDSDGDDHPNSEGNIKATTEFVPLLEKWYAEFLE